MNPTQPKIQNAHEMDGDPVNQKEESHDETRAGQPAQIDRPGPLWKAPLRSKPQNLNMQIQRVKTYNNK